VQMVLINSAKGSETIAAAGGQASFNLGNTFGAFFGGIQLTYGFAYNSPLLVGVAMVSIGILIAVYYLKMKKCCSLLNFHIYSILSPKHYQKVWHLVDNLRDRSEL